MTTGAREGKRRRRPVKPSGPLPLPPVTLTRAQRNIVTRQAYLDCSETAGATISPEQADQPVMFKHIASPMARVVLTLFVLANVATSGLFLGWLLLPDHVPGAVTAGDGSWQLLVARISYIVMIVVELIRLGQSVTVCLFAFFAKDPVPMDPPIGLRVALLTTIVPSKEPIEVAERTLRRMKQVLYAGQVDVWILDEGDDPAVKAMAERIGVKHFSRKGRPEYNTPAGQFRTKTKSGNHNSWRAEHEHDYDVVANVDPDHVPMTSFLERTLGYFRDPDVAFVVSPQVYGNMYQNWVAHGASVQQYLFNGIIARGGNGLDAPLLTGTGHLYRPSAMREIGGYQDSIIEDHVTSIKLHTSVNPETGNRWKGVYTPDVIAIGEGPTSWADYFNQQKRWAYGVWEIILHRRLHQSSKLPVRRRWGYRLLQFYYPSVAVSLMFGNIATAVYLATGVSAVDLNGTTWFTLWGATLVTWFSLLLWLRRYNIASHEREEIGMPGMGLALFCGPIYVAAGTAALFRRKLAFVVTAKGKMRTTESLGTFKLHMLWFLFAAGMLAFSFFGHHDYTLLRIWAGLTLLMGIAPPIAAWISGIRAKRNPEPEPRPLAEEMPIPEPTVEPPGPLNTGTAEIPSLKDLPPGQDRQLPRQRPGESVPLRTVTAATRSLSARSPDSPTPSLPIAGRRTPAPADAADSGRRPAVGAAQSGPADGAARGGRPGEGPVDGAAPGRGPGAGSAAAAVPGRDSGAGSAAGAVPGRRAGVGAAQSGPVDGSGAVPGRGNRPGAAAGRPGEGRRPMAAQAQSGPAAQTLADVEAGKPPARPATGPMGGPGGAHAKQPAQSGGPTPDRSGPAATHPAPGGSYGAPGGSHSGPCGAQSGPSGPHNGPGGAQSGPVDPGRRERGDVPFGYRADGKPGPHAGGPVPQRPVPQRREQPATAQQQQQQEQHQQQQQQQGRRQAPFGYRGDGTPGPQGDPAGAEGQRPGARSVRGEERGADPAQTVRLNDPGAGRRQGDGTTVPPVVVVPGAPARTSSQQPQVPGAPAIRPAVPAPRQPADPGAAETQILHHVRPQDRDDDKGAHR